MTCPYCKKSIDDDSDFCVHCGKSVVNDEAEAIRRKSKRKKYVIISAVIACLLVVGIVLIAHHNKEESNRILKEGYLSVAEINPRGAEAFRTILNEYCELDESVDYPDLVLEKWSRRDEVDGIHSLSFKKPIDCTVSYTIRVPEGAYPEIETVEATVVLPDESLDESEEFSFLTGVGYVAMLPLIGTDSPKRDGYTVYVYNSIARPSADEAGQNIYDFGSDCGYIDIYVVDGVAHLEAYRYSDAQIEAQSLAANLLADQAFSRSGLITAVTSRGYTQADVERALNYIEVDWAEQASLYAEKLIDGHTGEYTADTLVQKLQEYGFTQEEAEHGASQVDLSVPSPETIEFIEGLCDAFSPLQESYGISLPTLNLWYNSAPDTFACEVIGKIKYTLYVFAPVCNGQVKFLRGSLAVQWVGVDEELRTALLSVFMSYVEPAISQTTAESAIIGYRNSDKPWAVKDNSISPSGIKFSFSNSGTKEQIKFELP